MAYSIQEVGRLACPASKPSADTISDDETIARVLHSDICDRNAPSEKTFPIEQLMPGGKGSTKLFENLCGASSGVSVQRTPPSDNDDLQRRSSELAARKQGRVALGAAPALVRALRKIRIEERSDQVVFVMVDGSIDDPGHAIIRLNPHLSPGLARKVRERIIRLFRGQPLP